MGLQRRVGPGQRRGGWPIRVARQIGMYSATVGTPTTPAVPEVSEIVFAFTHASASLFVANVALVVDLFGYWRRACHLKPRGRTLPWRSGATVHAFSV